MSKKITKEEFIKHAEEIHGVGIYDFSKVVYVNNRTPVLIHCNICGSDFLKSPAEFLKHKNRGCKCQKIDQRITNLETFLKLEIEKYGTDKYSFENSIFINSKTPLLIHCNSCGSDFLKTPYNFLNGSECQCFSKITKEIFIKRAEEIYGIGRYGYDEVVYVNNTTPVKIYCPICKEYFYKTPHAFLDGKLGCRTCALKEKGRKQILSIEEFIKRARKIHGDLYDYSESVYINTNTKIKIKDNETGDIFWQTPQSHLHGYGNPKRTESKGEQLIRSCLEELGLVFKKEYFLKDKIVGRNSNIVRIDFQLYLNEKEIWIEYNGKQHYKFESEFWKRTVKEDSLDLQKQNFKDQLRRDNNIRNYCKENNIILLEIPYTYRRHDQLIKILGDILLNGAKPEDIIKYPEIQTLGLD